MPVFFDVILVGHRLVSPLFNVKKQINSINKLNHAIFITKTYTPKINSYHLLIWLYMNLLGEPRSKLFCESSWPIIPDVNICKFGQELMKVVASGCFSQNTCSRKSYPCRVHRPLLHIIHECLSNKISKNPNTTYEMVKSDDGII